MNGAVMMIFYVLLFVAIFYFLAVRPQRRQKQQHAEMMRAIKKGDEVVTVGGMFGTVRKLGDDWVELEVAPRTRVRYLKRAISTITQVPEEDEEEYVEDDEYQDAEETGQLEAGADDEYEDEAGAEDEAYDEADQEPEDAEQAPVAEEAPAVGGAKRRRK